MTDPRIYYNGHTDRILMYYDFMGDGCIRVVSMPRMAVLTAITEAIEEGMSPRFTDDRGQRRLMTVGNINDPGVKE